MRASLIRLGYCSRPKFLIIGTQKGGTVALRKYLARHPDIVPARKKEIGYFDQDILYRRGDSWYHGHFPLPHRLGRRGVTFEATPEYLYYPKAAQRIFSYDPDLKLIVLLREPIERAFSAWNMFRTLRYEHPDYLRAILPECDQMLREAIVQMLSSDPFPEFDEAVRDEINGMVANNSALEPSYVRRGIYHEQLLRYLRCFAREQILILESARLRRDLANVLPEVVQFLGLPEYTGYRVDQSLFHVGQYEHRMADETRAFLGEFYKPHNEKLWELLGRDFGW
ncbi:MAG: sulfotransferase domain-containing protein [Gemmatimonadales bacterium]